MAAKLAMTAVDYNRSADGRLRARFGEGAEYGFSPEGLRLSLAGQPVERHKHRLNASGSGGISDNVVFGVGIGIIVIGGAIGVIDAIGDD